MRWITLDPGETTGWSVWEGTDLVEAGQTRMWEHIDALDNAMSMPAVAAMEEPLEGHDEPFGALVCEDWQLYPKVMKTGALDYDHCRTARAIGAYTLIARQHGIPFILQGAAIKDAAETISEPFFVKPIYEMRHANDAIMHGVYRINTKGAPC